MADLNSVEEVQAEDYVIRVGKAEGMYEAAVIGVQEQTKEKERGPMSFTFTVSTKTETKDVDAPVMKAEHRWVAIGLAIEAYEWRQTDVEPSFDGLSATNVSDIDTEDLIDSVEAQGFEQ